MIEDAAPIEYASATVRWPGRCWGDPAHNARYIAEPFSKIYEKWAVSVGMPPELVTLKSGCKAFWMGDHKTAKYIVVYSHGKAQI